VDGLKADINSDKIVWASGDTLITINRLNGALLSKSDDSDIVLSGQCELVKNKMF
jgi:hypothetical protein